MSPRSQQQSSHIARLLKGRRLLLVSNREPYKRRERDRGGVTFQRTAGGLVTALDPVMRRCGGVWVAWEPGGDADMDLRHQVPEQGNSFTMRQVPLSTGEVRRYYYGFANRTLWPLCHYFIERFHFDEQEWQQYVQVNRKFADVVCDEARVNDVLWVHDYHFCLLPEMVRETRREGGPIAFFLHIPFPAEEVFRILPWREELLRGMLGADLVGFHVGSYAGHFLGCCQRLLGADVDHERSLVHWQGRQVRVGSFPIGIDVDEFTRLANDPENQARGQELRQILHVDKVVLGVDRMDYSKGIPERLHAIDALFRNYPEHRQKTTFIQVAVPSRTRVKEYRELKRQIDELVGRINGHHGRADWQPIRYVFRSLPRQELVAHYLAADVALITPLRDGMNLVAKEFCACRVHGDGGLVLSEFTGAAQQLEDGAFLVNPFDVEAVATTLDRALDLPLAEQRRRMRQLRDSVEGADINAWLSDVLTATLSSVPAAAPAGS